MANEKCAVLKVNEIGCGSIVVDGCDLSNYVARVIISTDVGRPTRLTIVMNGVSVAADVKAKIDAIIENPDRGEDCKTTDVTTVGTSGPDEDYRQFKSHG